MVERVSIICPVCKGRCFIEVWEDGLNPGRPVRYRCWRCNETGIEYCDNLSDDFRGDDLEG